MKFSMCDDEIRVSYNTAKDQKAQIKILAELNVTTPAAMAARMVSEVCTLVAATREISAGSRPASRAAAAIFSRISATACRISSKFFSAI